MEENFKRVIDVLKQAPSSGISEVDIFSKLKDIPPQQRMELLNRLAAQGRIELFQRKGTLVYKFVAEGFRGADNEETVVHRIIKESGNKGIWIRDIRLKSNLPATQLNKILKNLESKKNIKSVKTVTGGKKKVYMLFDLEPDQTLSSGSWYSGEDFDSEFVDVLNTKCHEYLMLQKRESKVAVGGPCAEDEISFKSVADITKFVHNLGICKVKLSEDDMISVLNTLVYDRKAERKELPNGTFMYKSVSPIISPPGVICSPCGVCPILGKCAPTCSVSYESCSYLSDWLAKK